MLDSISLSDLLQIIVTYPAETFFACISVFAFIVFAVYGLASFRLFEIKHYHTHYYPAPPQSPHPYENLRPGYYYLGIGGAMTPVQTQPAAPSAAPNAPRTNGFDAKAWMDELTADIDRATGGTANYFTTKPNNNRRKMKSSKRMRILRRDGFRCQLCGRAANDADGLTLHVDHRMPVAKGGGDEDSNLWTLCSECNGAKSDTVMEELIDSPSADDDAGQGETK